MKRFWPIVFLTSAFAASPPKKSASPPKKPPEDYTSWNNIWYASCGDGEFFRVAVKVGSPKKAGPHSFDAYFQPDYGDRVCKIGTGAPIQRVQFLHGTMTSGTITGTIFLCTTNQELVDANHLSASFTRDFTASYDPEHYSMTGNYKGEYYKRADFGAEQAYQRDEPGDPKGAFEMHQFAGQPWHVTRKEESPQDTPAPDSPASQAQKKLNDLVSDGVHIWWKDFLKEKFGVDY